MDSASWELTAKALESSVSSFWMIMKWVYVFAFGVYVGFAVVVLAQVKQMMMALSGGGFDRGLKLVAWGNLTLAILALLLAIVVL